MSATTDITSLGAAALARAIRSRELSCREDLCLDAAEAIEAAHGAPEPIDPTNT